MSGMYYFICVAFHQELVFDRRDEILQLRLLWISSLQRLCSLHPCDNLAFWQVCDSQICQQWQHDESLHNMLAMKGVSRTDRERSDDQMVHCIFLTRWTQRTGFITKTDESMNESRPADWLKDKKTHSRCQYMLKLLSSLLLKANHVRLLDCRTELWCDAHILILNSPFVKWINRNNKIQTSCCLGVCCSLATKSPGGEKGNVGREVIC